MASNLSGDDNRRLRQVEETLYRLVERAGDIVTRYRDDGSPVMLKDECRDWEPFVEPEPEITDVALMREEMARLRRELASKSPQEIDARRAQDGSPKDALATEWDAAPPPSGIVMRPGPEGTSAATHPRTPASVDPVNPNLTEVDQQREREQRELEERARRERDERANENRATDAPPPPPAPFTPTNPADAPRY